MGISSIALNRSNEPECVIQPIVDARESEAMGSDLAVSAGAFSGSETHEGPGAGEVFVEFLGLASEEHVLFSVEDQDGAGDFLGDAVAKM
jgi:hypothetical protein